MARSGLSIGVPKMSLGVCKAIAVRRVSVGGGDVGAARRKGATSPALYVLIVGGLFVGIPLVCGTGIVTECLLDGNKTHRSKLPSNQLKRKH